MGFSAATLEPVVQPELERAGAHSVVRVVLAGEFPEVVQIHVLIRDVEVRVVEDIVGVGVYFYFVPLGDTNLLVQREVVALVPRSIEAAALEIPDRAGLRVEKDLAGKRRRTVGRDTLRVRVDVRRIE